MCGLDMFGIKFAPIRGQIVRFAVSTGFSASMSFLLPIALHEGLGIPQNSAVAIGFFTAYVGNFLLLRKFVFRSSANWRGEAWRYIVVNGSFRLCEYGAYYSLTNVAQLDYRLAVFLVLAAAAVVKFFVYRLVFIQGALQGNT